MDKDFLLDLMVNVRERMIPIDEAVETICALAENDDASTEPSINYDGVLDAVTCDCCGNDLTNKSRLCMPCAMNSME